MRTTGTTRRAVLRAGALTVVSAAGASACTIGGSPSATPPKATADDRVRAAVITDVGVLVASYRAAIAALPDLVATVGSLLAEHEAHLQALGPYPSTVPSPPPGSTTASPSSSASSSGGPTSTATPTESPSPPSASVSASASDSASAEPVAATSPPAKAAPRTPSPQALALDKLRALELAASPRAAAQTAEASPQLARLVASIAGCQAAHAAVLRARR